MFVERGMEVAGVRTRALVVDGEGPPFVLLHGFADSADTWRPLLRRLAKRRRAAIAVDMPGFGTAGRLRPDPILPQLDAFASELVREHTGGEAPIVVGNSLGGVVGLRAAADPTAPIRGLAAISPAGLGHARWVEILTRDPIVHNIVRVPLPLPAPVIRRAASIVYRRLVVASAARVDPSVFATFGAHFRSRDDAVRTVREARRLLCELELPDCYRLERIAVPVLLLWGTRDWLVPASGAKRVLDAVPRSRLVTLDGLGHCAQIEEPGRVADLLVEFSDQPATVEAA